MPDADCLVVVINSRDERSAVAAEALRRRLDRGDQLVLAAHALVECYSVLTRIPEPARLAPHAAATAIEASFVSNGIVVALGEQGYIDLVQRAPAMRVHGGRVYDAVIAACARQAKVDEFLTFNPRHYRVLLEPDIRVVVPGAD